MCTTLCETRGYKPIAQCLHARPVDVWHLFGYLRRPPNWGAFRKLLQKIDIDVFENAVARWMENCLGRSLSADELAAISIDGKVFRGSCDRLRDIVCLLSAFGHQTGGVLGQHGISSDTDEEKACHVFLRQLLLKGRVLVFDAAFN